MDPQDALPRGAAGRVPFRLDLELDDARFPRGRAQPVLAVPVASRVRRYALVLYGGHDSGADLDRNERALLARLAAAAAEVYAAVEADQLRRRVAALEARAMDRATAEP